MDRKESIKGNQQNKQVNKKKSNKNVQYFAMEDPYDLSQRFLNLSNALKFIESPDIRKLEKNYFDLKNQLKRQQQSKSEFSKSIYKKVISRDNDFNFQHNIESLDYDSMEDFNHRQFDTGHQLQTAQKVKRANLLKKYKHGEIASTQQKKERLREQSQIPLNFKHVKAIETAQFEKLKDVQFYSLIKGQNEDKDIGHSGGGSAQLETLSIYNYQSNNFKHNLITNSQYNNKHSYNFLFDCNRQLTFWRLQNIFKEEKKTEEEVLSNCAFFDPSNVTSFQVFDFASRNIQINDIYKFYQLKEHLRAKMDMERNNESLEEKYNEAKRRFQEMKELRLKTKNQRIPAKFISSVAQTNDQMQEKDFDQYFVEDAKNIFDRLAFLNLVRDRIVEEEDGEAFDVMAKNVGLQIGKELFKLLMLVLKGQKAINYAKFIEAENEQEVEKRILEIIYLEFKNFTSYEVNGISKTEIIKNYLSERQKNERFFEAYIYKRGGQKQAKGKAVIKKRSQLKK